MTRRRLGGILLLLVGAAVGVLGVVIWQAGRRSPEFNTAPLDIAIQLKPGTHVRAPFNIEKHEIYVVNVEFPTPRTFDKFTQLEQATDQIEVVWQISASGKRTASGRSPSRTWFHAGKMTGKTVGEFSVAPGTYVIEATVRGVPSALTGIDGRFAVLLNQNSMTDLGYTIELLPYIRYFGIGVLLVGVLLLIGGWLASKPSAA